jgi:uncharacterized protein GlcG (DUF336 family)
MPLNATLLRDWAGGNAAPRPIPTISIEGLLAFAGAVPIRLDARLIGAVAVSGGTSAQNKEIAESAANATN